MHAVYRITSDIPALNARRGDLLYVDPADPVAPIQVVRQIMDRGLLPLVLAHEGDMELLSLDPPVSSESHSEWLRRQLVQPA